MEDDVDAVQELIERASAEVLLYEGAPRNLRDGHPVRPLLIEVVVVGQAIDRRNGVSLSRETLAQVASDETSGPRDQDSTHAYPETEVISSWSSSQPSLGSSSKIPLPRAIATAPRRECAPSLLRMFWM